MGSISVQMTDEYKKAHPQAVVGFMTINCPQNAVQNDAMQREKTQLIQKIQAQYPQKQDIINAPVIQAYQKYYQQFKSNYHVRFQIESIALKGKELPIRSVLVDAMFMAEVQYGLLIAGHDSSAVQPPLTVDCTNEVEIYTQLGGGIKTLKAGDMCIRDARKILSNILYGPDDSSPISLDTTQALYCIYGPDGISADQIKNGLDAIAENIKTAIPDMEIESQTILSN